MPCEIKYITLLDLARQAKIITGDTACFDGKIQAGLPFSAYTTGPDLSTTGITGNLVSENAMFSGNTGTTTVFDVANPLSPNYNPIFDPYSAFTWTNPNYSANTSGLILPITIDTAFEQIVGPVWIPAATGKTGEHIIVTEYTGYTITYNFFQVSSEGLSVGSVSGLTSALQINYSADSLDYKGPIDYLRSREDATVDNLLTTKKLKVTGGASDSTIGYVLTQVDSGGTAEWAFNSSSASTNTFVASGALNVSDDLILTYNTAGTVPPIDLSSLNFTGGPADCITDLYTTNIHACSPLNINPLDEGNVYFGSTSGVSVDVPNSRIGIGTAYTEDRLQVQDGNILVRHDHNSDTRLRLMNIDTGITARSLITLSNMGMAGKVTSGLICYMGPNFTGLPTFTGDYLPNSLNITTAGGGGADRAHINIGSRGTTGETRFFGGDEDFNDTTLLGRFLPTHSVILGGIDNQIDDNTTSSSILGGESNYITGNTSGSDNNTIIGGNNNLMVGLGPASADNNSILGGESNSMAQRSIRSTIIGGTSNIIGATPGATVGNAVILGGDSNVFPGSSLSTNSVILGGTGITGSSANTAYVPTLNIDTTPTTDNTLNTVLVRDADGTIKSRSAGSISSGFTGNTSATCINELWVTTISGCSPITMGSEIQSANSFALGTGSFAFAEDSDARAVQSAILGGEGHNINTGAVNSVIIGGQDNIIDTGVRRSVILGGQNITALVDESVYVPRLNIGTVGGDTSLLNLGIDSDGFVVSGDNLTVIYATDLAELKGAFDTFNNAGFKAGIVKLGGTITLEGDLDLNFGGGIEVHGGMNRFACGSTGATINISGTRFTFKQCSFSANANLAPTPDPGYVNNSINVININMIGGRGTFLECEFVDVVGRADEPFATDANFPIVVDTMSIWSTLVFSNIWIGTREQGTGGDEKPYNSFGVKWNVGGSGMSFICDNWALSGLENADESTRFEHAQDAMNILVSGAAPTFYATVFYDQSLTLDTRSTSTGPVTNPNGWERYPTLWGSNLNLRSVDPTVTPLFGTQGDIQVTGTSAYMKVGDIGTDTDWISLNAGSSPTECITDFYATNIHACSPLNINPLDEGDVFFGSTSGVTIDVINKRLGVGTSNPSYPLEIFGPTNEKISFIDSSTAPQFNISGSPTQMIRLVATEGTSGIGIGVRGELEGTFPNYGEPGDTHIRGGENSHGLNIIEAASATHDDYIRFYAGQSANPANTPDIHIQGVGATRGNVGINTKTPSEKLHISGGTMRIEDGTEQSGYVLTSDADGVASWVEPDYSACCTTQASPGPSAFYIQLSATSVTAVDANFTNTNTSTITSSSPLNINDGDEGDVIIGADDGFVFDVAEEELSIKGGIKVGEGLLSHFWTDGHMGNDEYIALTPADFNNGSAPPSRAYGRISTVASEEGALLLTETGVFGAYTSFAMKMIPKGFEAWSATVYTNGVSTGSAQAFVGEINTDVGDDMSGSVSADANGVINIPWSGDYTKATGLNYIAIAYLNTLAEESIMGGQIHIQRIV